MNAAARIGALERNFELARQSGEFVSLARILLQSKGDILVARRFTDRVSPRVKELLASDQILNIIGRGGIRRGDPSDEFIHMKAAQSAQTLDSAFGTYNLLVAGFVNALSSIGAFDQMRSSMRAVPLGRTIGAVTTAATAYVVGQGSAKQVSKLALVNGSLDPAKAHCIVAISNELLKFGGPDLDALLMKELINASVLALDTAFVNILIAGVSAATSVGATAPSVRNDIANLLISVPTDQTSKLFILTTPLICKMWAAMGATSNDATPAFPDMGPQGGTILNVPVIASDGVPSGDVVLVDATGIAAGSDTIVLSTMAEGTIMPDTAPDSPVVSGTNVVSLWQSNLSALLAERWWGAVKLRSSAVAACTNSNSYQSGFSPP